LTVKPRRAKAAETSASATRRAELRRRRSRRGVRWSRRRAEAAPTATAGPTTSSAGEFDEQVGREAGGEFDAGRIHVAQGEAMGGIGRHADASGDAAISPGRTGRIRAGRRSWWRSRRNRRRPSRRRRRADARRRR
jgi:hypothetical protein